MSRPQQVVQYADRAMDTAVGASWVTVAGMTLGEWSEVVQIVSLAAATVASICASIYYMRKGKRERREHRARMGDDADT